MTRTAKLAIDTAVDCWQVARTAQPIARLPDHIGLSDSTEGIE